MIEGGRIQRLLMTTDTVGGVWDYSLELCRSLQAFGVDVVLASMGPSPHRDQRRGVSRLSNVAFHPSRYRLEWMPSPWGDIARAGDWLLALGEGADAVHLNQFCFGGLDWPVPSLVVAHSDVLTWFEAVLRDRPGQEWGTYQDAVSGGLRGANIVVAPSRAMLEALRRHYGDIPEAYVIHNTRDGRLYRAGAKEPFILAAGRLWDKGKNLHILDGAARRIEWEVRLAGSLQGGDDRPWERATLLGRLSSRRLAEVMARASIYLLPAKYEPFGLSALEAALSGCALILGRIPSLRELWGDCALYVDPGDEDEIVHASNQLIKHVGLREVYAARALRRALEINQVPMAHNYMRIYNRLIFMSDNKPLHIKDRT